MRRRREKTASLSATAALSFTLLVVGACGENTCEDTRTCEPPTGSGGDDGQGGHDGGGLDGSGGTANSGGSTTDASASGGTGGGGSTDDDAGTTTDGGADAGGPLTIAVSELPKPTLNVPFEFTIVTTGGNGDVSFRLASGALPAGLTLSASGSVEGTPTTWGDFSITVEATSGDDIVTRAFQLRVVSRLWLAFDNAQKNGSLEKFVLNVGAGEPYAPTKLGIPGTQEAWSPDGRHLSFITTQGTTPTMQLVDLTGTEAAPPKPVWTGPAGCVPLVAWAPDSSRIAIGCGKTVEIASLAKLGDAPRKATFVDPVTAVTWSPDSRWFIASSKAALRGYYSLVFASTLAVTEVSTSTFTSERQFWTPTSDQIISFGRRLSDPFNKYFTARLGSPTNVVSTYDGDLFADPEVPPLLTRDGKYVLSVGAYDGAATFRQFVLSDISTPVPTTVHANRRFVSGGEVYYLDPKTILPVFAHNEQFVLYFCALNDTLCVLDPFAQKELNGVALTAHRFALDASKEQALFPVLKYVNVPGTTEERGAFGRYKFGTAGVLEVEILNTPTTQTRQPDFGFAADAKAAYFLESVGGAPPKTYYVDLRQVVHRTTLLATGGTSVLGSTAYSPSGTHLTTLVGGSAGAATLKIFDVRGKEPSAAVTLSGDGIVKRVTWQPTWD